MADNGADGKAEGKKTIWEQVDSQQLGVAISVAMRQQSATLREGGMLDVGIPNSKERVQLPILKIGKLDPDVLERNEFVDPKMDRPPMPGVLLDMNPVMKGSNNYLGITFLTDQQKVHTSLTKDTLVKEYGINNADADAFTQKVGNNLIRPLGFKYSSGGPEPKVTPASASELQAEGLTAAAAAISAAPQPQIDKTLQQRPASMQ